MIRLLPLLFLATAAQAVPLDLTHQGRLFDSSGVPLNAPTDLTVSLYGSATGSDVLWTETFTDVDFEAGYFSLTLPDVDGPAVDADELWVGIAVGSDAELSRIVVNSVPFALRAGSVSGGVVDATEVRVDGQTVIGADGTIDYGQLVNLPDTSDTLSELGCSGGDVAVMDDASQWSCVDQADLAVNGSSLVGTVDVSALPVGNSSGTVAAGDHTHTAADVGAVATSGGTVTGALSVTDALDAASVQVTGDGGTCDSGAVGTFAVYRGQPVYCDGTDWQLLSTRAVKDGSNEGRAASSCAAALADFPGSTDGVYWLKSGSSAAFEAYCDMSNGGWTLVMKTQKGSDLLKFSSPHWTDPSASLATDSLDRSAANARLEAYTRLPFTELRGCADNGGLKCIEHDFGGSGYSSALALFTAGEILLYPNPTANSGITAAAAAYRDAFYDVFTPSGQKDCAPKELGFNITAQDGNFARWGFANNVPEQPCQVQTNEDADAVIGWGLDGQDAGETGAGFTSYFVSNTTNSGNEASFDSWLWVR